ncbi:nitric oxide reductase large subunit [Halobacteriovorax marinus]|uniref:nitric-oxide reductase large subunit n=1 Tax=Halobacteriovorax marinus TaxID=97084 RepID=UPI000BC2F3AF|nr:nitric-oxide reductase large subunit [Halobacteriovorax marinus]ATH07316.1 nitric oxide reductase large subunit [Halobacteriovorax marinus]
MKKYWWTLVFVLVGTFTILGFFGSEVYKKAPPLYESINSSSQGIIYTKDDILDGQEVWQSIGGQQIGSIWGHGAYQAPDWTADWLHRELVNYQTIYSQNKLGKSFNDLSKQEKMLVKASMLEDYRESKVENDKVLISDIRYQAYLKTKQYYLSLFSNSPELRETRKAYAIHEEVLPSAERREKMMAFFHWSTWAASANRPGENHTYTNNWPHEPLIDNVPTSENIFWSIISVILLLTSIGFLVWYYAFKKEEDDVNPELPSSDPLKNFKLTPSMKSLWKYWGVVVVLFILQIGLGGILAHYTVEGQDFYGFPLSKFLPYTLARTWHIQIALFWIATSFLAAGLFIAPIINGGKDPKFQRFGVNFLFGALLVVVFGSLTGEALAIHQLLDFDLSFWFGHQGYEYVDLGRVWQILLLVGLGVWLTLMLRCIAPALKIAKDNKQLLLLFSASTIAIGLFYGGGLFYGARTHISIMEFWRWWVVHLWVEGFFEVFATVALAFIFVTLGLIKPRSATKASLLSTSIFLVGGIPGTFHHLYFSGTPISISAIGACFSALEVVPLVLIGFEAFHTFKVQKLTSWTKNYKWPITFFVGVAFWNLVGAGIFGFLINPPIALYYLQGLNTTAVHAHGATFGVYGLLSLGLVLFIVQTTFQERKWNDKIMGYGFWGMNIGLGLMIILSLLPIGLIQFDASLEIGLWYARGSEVMQSDLIQNLRWLRVIGDVIFALGAVFYALAILDKTGLYKLKSGKSEFEGDLVVEN